MPTKDQLHWTAEGEWFKMQCAAFEQSINDPAAMQKAFFDDEDQELPEEYKLKIASKQIQHSFYWKNEFLRNAYPCKITLPQEIITNTDREHMPPIVILPAMEFNSVSAAFAAWHVIDYMRREEIQKKEKNMSLDNRISFIKKLPPEYGYIRTGTYHERKAMMTDLLSQKYSENNPQLCDNLLKTDNNLLLIDGDLGNDNWQYGFDIHKKHGQNLTGRITMGLRDHKTKGKTLTVL